MIKIKSRLLLLEALFFLGLARLLMLSIPFKKLASIMGKANTETIMERSEKSDQQKNTLRRIVHQASEKTWWESKCLVRAIALAWMLKRRGYSYTIYLGVGKDEKNEMIAHAWIRSGDVWLSGEEQRDKFTVVGTFSS